MPGRSGAGARCACSWTSPAGITLEVLTRINRVVGQLLEVHDVDSRVLHPGGLFSGATRALKKPEDYRRYAGRLVRLTTRAPWEGRQVHRGILQGLEDDDGVPARRREGGPHPPEGNRHGPAGSRSKKYWQGGLAPHMNSEN